MHFCCRTPPGVRGLKYRLLCAVGGEGDGRTPPGVRGLKYIPEQLRAHRLPESHPTRGAWIEIEPFRGLGVQKPRRTPPGVRGLKYFHLSERVRA